MLITRRDQIAPEFKRRYKEMCEELGVDILPKEESWALSEWYRQEHIRFVENERKIEAKERAKEYQQKRDIEAWKVGEKKIIAPQDRICPCGNPLVKKPGPGRWPTKCATCKGK